MNISTQAKQIGAVLAAAAITTPVALAASALPSSGSSLSHPSGPASTGTLLTPHQTEGSPSPQCPCNVGLPGGPAVVTARQTASVLSSQCPCNVGLPGGPAVVAARQTASVLSSQCPCNVGLPGGPAVVGQVVLGPSTVTKPQRSFDWGDAGIGASFMAGIGLLAAGVALMLRRRRVLAQLHP